MKFLLSNIDDIHFSESQGRYVYHCSHATADKAIRHQLGLELADLSMAGNLDQNRQAVMDSLHQYAALMKGLPLVIHAPFSELYPHAMESMIREVANRLFQQAYAIAEELVAQTMVVHANQVATIYHPDWFVEHQIAFWKSFRHSHPGRCTIAIENTIDETPTQLLQIAEGVDDPHFGICLDVGHANLSATPVVEWIRTLAPKIAHYHIHNNMGVRGSKLWYQYDSHNALGEGVLDYEHLLHLIEELTPDATITLETSALDESVDWLMQKHFI